MVEPMLDQHTTGVPPRCCTVAPMVPDGDPDAGLSEIATPTPHEPATLATGGGAAPLLVQRFRVAVIAGPDLGLDYTSRGHKVIVGTHGSCDVLLTDRAVSRFHLELRADPQRGLLLRDLGSSNGTTVDGVGVIEAPLRGGAVVAVGQSRLRVDLGPDRFTVAVSTRSRFGLLLGSSPEIRATFAVLERAAASDATVLLAGETGTGKSVAAESIHSESARRDHPFVVVDCGALPATLLESELFGHERGAFTGADRARPGALEEAHGGTLFLDEIGELALDLQPKLLRVLETRQTKRVGSNKYVPADVRLIAATNRNLREEVNRGRFRADLYYRLAVLEIAMPALRDHPEDLPALVEAFYASRGRLDDAERAGLRSPDFHRELTRHAWPGNIRELGNYLERCLAMQAPVPIGGASASGDSASDGPVDGRLPHAAARERWNAWCERRYLTELLARHAGSVSAAAREAGLSRAHMYRLIAQYQLR
jgi:two-component system response regulator GlrR